MILLTVRPELGGHETLDQIRVALPHEAAVGLRLDAEMGVGAQERFGRAPILHHELRDELVFRRPPVRFLLDAPRERVGDVLRPFRPDVFDDQPLDEIRVQAGEHLHDAAAGGVAMQREPLETELRDQRPRDP